MHDPAKLENYKITPEQQTNSYKPLDPKRIDAAKWDAAKQRVRNGCSNKLHQTAAQINADLSAYETHIQDIFKQFEVQGSIPRPDELKEAFAVRCHNQKEVPLPCQTAHETFVEAFDAFVRECGTNNHWTHATRDKFMALRKHLLDFDAEISFEVFNEEGLNAFLGYLCQEKQMRNTTLGNQAGFIKWFLRWAHQKGYPVSGAFASFRPKLKNTPKKVLFLTRDELRRLSQYPIPRSKQYLERVRDVFLFCCYTGLRYSDVYNLRRGNVKADWIEVTTVKTADSLRIELNDHSRAILEKYRSVPFAEGKVLPVVSNQKMNDYLKELAELAGIDEPVRETYYRGNERIEQELPKYALIGTHCARRTFICNALSLGIPAQVVMKWTGHSDYKAMKPYIDIADETKALAMNKFNQLQ